MRTKSWLTILLAGGLAGCLTGCLLDWDRDGRRKGADCNDLDGDDEPPREWYLDDDGDGYGTDLFAVTSCLWPVGWVSNAEDCDDDRPSWHPGAEDTWYDQDDSNCDGLNDFDADQDGYVVSGSSEHKGGSAPNDGDCDDYNPGVNPGQEEIWYDGVNQDCGNVRDFDADQDGEDAEEYGGTDCDDTDPTVRSGVSEDCSNGVDDNCDGLFDSQAWPDADGDGYGDSARAPIEACEPPDGYADNADDCDDADPTIHPGAAEICGNGADENCSLGDRAVCGYLEDLELSESDGRLFGGGGQRAGLALALAGDQDGDGARELLIGGQGAAWLAPHTRGDAELDATSLARFVNGTPEAGASVAWPGDFDGDGTADLLIGGASMGSGDDGRVWLVSGPASGDVDLDGAAAILLGAGGAELGAAVTGGDLRGDGRATLALGAPGSGLGGEVALLPSGETGTRAFAALEDRVIGEAGMSLGRSLAICPDLDGDGLDELAIGESSVQGGTVFLFSGGVAGALSTGDADISFWAESDGDGVGAAVSGAGDVDGDGGEDLAIGAPGDDSGAVGAGAVYVITDHGSNGFHLSLATAQGAKLIGERTGDQVGFSLTRAGDLDGDSYADLLIGVPGESAVASDRGAVYLVRGPVTGVITLDTADAKHTGEALNTFAGAALLAGDSDGDGATDLAIGGYGARDYSGAIYLLFGAP